MEMRTEYQLLCWRAVAISSAKILPSLDTDDKPVKVEYGCFLGKQHCVSVELKYAIDAEFKPIHICQPLLVDVVAHEMAL